MYRKSITRTVRIVFTLVLVIMLLSVTVIATNNDESLPRASYYLDSYNTYVYPAGWGKIQVYFDVTGVDYMDDIGALTIQIYESNDNKTWTWVKTYTHDTTAGMLGYNKIYHSGHVDYQGTIGRYYKAYVCIWAGTNGNGDSRYMWTLPKKATLFAG